MFDALNLCATATVTIVGFVDITSSLHCGEVCFLGIDISGILENDEYPRYRRHSRIALGGGGGGGHLPVRTNRLDFIGRFGFHVGSRISLQVTGNLKN